MDISFLEKTIDFVFKNKNLLKEALTHRSYLNENPSWNIPHNERLEFLGDAVLELAVTKNLFNVYPDEQEGQLTSIRAALVNYQMLSQVARSIGLEDHILLSRGEAKDVGRAREIILANVMESLIGAIYLDKDYEEAEEFIVRFLIEPHLKKIVENGLYRDPKSRLQEIVQEKLKATPHYEVLEEWGPDHKKIFKTGVFFGNQLAAEGEGYSKQESEVEAAKKALKSFV